MFSTDKTIDSLQALFTEVKHYVDLQKDYIKLDITHKLTVLLSTLILILVLVILGYAIITGGILLLGILVYVFRQRLIIQPLINFLANLLLNDK